MGYVTRRSKGEFVLHPEGGPFRAVLARYVVREGVETQFGMKDRVQFIFQTETRLRDHLASIDDDRPIEVSVFCNDSINKGSRMLELVTAQIPGKRFEDMVAATGGGFDLDMLLGTQWLLTIAHNDKDGRTFCNVASTMKAPPGPPLPIWDVEVGEFIDTSEPEPPKAVSTAPAARRGDLVGEPVTVADETGDDGLPF
jgi:hypothetical protein